MHRMTLLRVLLVSFAALAWGGAGTAWATTVDYSGDGSTLIVSGGDNAAHDIQFRLSADLAHDQILDTSVIDPIPLDCVYNDVDVHKWVICPAHLNVQVDLGAGNDGVTFVSQGFDCFNGYVLNLGDGANTLNLSGGCPTAPDDTASVTSGSGPDTLTAGNQGATFSAGGGDDNLYGGSGNDVLHGGDANDRIFGGPGNDQVLGEGGNDDVDGGTENDLVDGGGGDDRLEYSTGVSNDAGAGADTYVGGPGTDKLTLDAHAGGVTITIDGAANDGLPNEGDNVGADIEQIDGTGGNDVFTGSAGTDNFLGGSGNDEIHGAGGNDDLYGGSGDDRIFGDAGNDKVQGANGSDTVDGGSGADQIYGDIGSCSFSCSFDADTILARDGEKDAVDCGSGADSAQVDFVDVVAFCASVDRSPAPGPPAGAATPGSGTAVSFTVGAKPSVGKGVGTTVTCPAACTFTVAITISAKTARKFGLGRKALKIGSARGALLAAGSTKAKVKLSAKARRRLRHAKKVPATLKVTAKDAGGKVTVATRSISLKP
jgi:Ca2+-binding RTX toxin-like protein